MKQPKIEDAIKYIKEHNVLPKWSDVQIQNLISEAIQSCTFAFSCNQSGELTGIVVGRWNARNSIHIVCMVGKNQLKDFIKYLRMLYPRCEHLTCYRDGKFKHFEVSRF